MSFLQKFIRNRTRIKKLVKNYNGQVATFPIDLLLQNLTKNRQTVAGIFLTTCSAERLANLRFRFKNI